MDIAAASMALSQANVGEQVGIALMKMGKEQIEQNGANLIEDLKSMELSVNPNVGSQIDIRL